ncbi:MAG TPA: DinB family protein [Ktedonobacterales bacterium]|nr:DinB family protein [Ktedonobacterales bacterium]
MSGNQPTAMTFYQGWDVYQGHLTRAIAPLTQEQLTLRAAPHLRTLDQIASHIIGARARWFHDLMGEGGEEIVRVRTFDRPGTPSHTAAELLQGLETTWQLMADCLNRWTLADLEYSYPGDPADGEPERLTRQWVLWHLIEHDVHHGGELSLTLGMHGLAAPDL